MNTTEKVVTTIALGLAGAVTLTGVAIVIKAKIMLNHIDQRQMARRTLLKKMKANKEPQFGDVLYYILETDRINNIKI